MGRSMKDSDRLHPLGNRFPAGKHNKDSKTDRAATLECFESPADVEFEPCMKLPVYRIMSVPVAPVVLETLSAPEEPDTAKAMEHLDLEDAPCIEVSRPVPEKPALKKPPNFFRKLAMLFHPDGNKHVNFGEIPPEPQPRRTSKFLNIFVPPRSASHSPTISVLSSDMSINSEELEVIREKLPMKATSEELSFCRKYQFVDSKIIGRGASGVVRLGRVKSDPALRVAVKEFRKRRRNETRHQYLMKLTAEYLIGSRLKHPNVISMLDIVHDGKKWFEVMEYCPGGDLFSAIQKNELDIDEIDSAFYQILQGVAYLHSLGVAHRDLKPENLLVDCAGFVKIADFGVSEVFLLDDPVNPASSIALDQEQYCCKKFRLSHGVCGSSPYIAPEEFAQGDYDARAVDVWALGIIYFTMVFHTIPWCVAQMSDEGYRHFIQYGAKGFEPFKRLSYGARTLLKRMLEADPGKRISIDEILQDEWVRAIQVCPIRQRKSGGKHNFNFD